MGILARGFTAILHQEPETLNRVLRFYIHHRNLYNKGQAELGFFRNIVSFQPLLITWLTADRFLEKMHWAIPMWVVFGVLALVVMLKVIAQWFVGYWWDEKRVFDKENDWSNNRNPIQKTVNDMLLNGKGIEH